MCPSCGCVSCRGTSLICSSIIEIHWCLPLRKIEPIVKTFPVMLYVYNYYIHGTFAFSYNIVSWSWPLPRTYGPCRTRPRELWQGPLDNNPGQRGQVPVERVPYPNGLINIGAHDSGLLGSGLGLLRPKISPYTNRSLKSLPQINSKLLDKSGDTTR